VIHQTRASEARIQLVEKKWLILLFFMSLL